MVCKGQSRCGHENCRGWVLDAGQSKSSPVPLAKGGRWVPEYKQWQVSPWPQASQAQNPDSTTSWALNSAPWWSFDKCAEVSCGFQTHSFLYPVWKGKSFSSWPFKQSLPRQSQVPFPWGHMTDGKILLEGEGGLLSEEREPQTAFHRKNVLTFSPDTAKLRAELWKAVLAGSSDHRGQGLVTSWGWGSRLTWTVS